MENSELRSISFSTIDKNDGKQLDLESIDVDDAYPLEVWYVSVYEKSLGEFTNQDLAKACGQNLHPEYIVPIVIGKLRQEPLLGDMYEGEMIFCLQSISKDFWCSHPKLTRELKQILLHIQSSFEDDVVEYASGLLKNLGHA